MLIKMITEEVLSKIKNEINFNNKKILVIFTGSTIGLEESINELKKIKEYGFKMKAVLSEFSLNVIDINILNEIFDKEDIYIDGKFQTNEEIYKENFDLLIGANLTINTLSKVAVGICDTLPTRLISSCIMNGTEIIAVKDGCDLENPERDKIRYKNIPDAFVNMIKGYLDRLESFGIKLINSKNLFEYSTKKVSKVDILNDISLNENIKVSKEKILKEDNIKEIQKVEKFNNAQVKIDKKIISREDIALNSKSKKILVPSYAIITSLAKDLCDEMDIQIIKG